MGNRFLEASVSHKISVKEMLFLDNKSLISRMVERSILEKHSLTSLCSFAKSSFFFHLKVTNTLQSGGLGQSILHAA